MTALDINELLAVEPGSYGLEDERHAQFAEHRLSRRRTDGVQGSGPKDWFRPGADLMAHIADLRVLHAVPAIRREVPKQRNALSGQEYNNLHHRMRRHRGRAADQKCAKCDAAAAHWARLHETDGLDIWNDYVPMCIKCHRAYDLGGHPMSAEHRESLSLAAQNRTPEHLRKIGEALKGRSDIGMAGKHHSEETRRKMRASQPSTGKKLGPLPPEVLAKRRQTIRQRLAAQQQSETLF